MSALAWLSAPRGPLDRRERRHARLLTAVIVAGAVLLLALTPHHAQPGRAPARVGARTLGPDAAEDGALRAAATSLSPPVLAAARVFLDGYLAYAYGHAPASQIADATPALAASLAAYPPRITPGEPERPHVIDITLTSASARTVTVRALVNDGGLIDYPITLLVEGRARGPLVDALEPA